MASIQHTISKVRPPRVQITYDVEVGEASESKELAFVMGIMSDLSAKSNIPLPVVKERKFVEVDCDNFGDFMFSIQPRVEFSVKNKIDPSEDAKDILMDITFNTMEDFEPLSIAKRNPEFNALYESRVKLMDLIAKLDGNDPLEEMLKLVMKNPEIKDALKAEFAQPQE
jgi:type VI secretion system ImpB/VipA family protein